MTIGLTIYIIDDDDAVRDSLRVLLECVGFRVVEYASCRDFLQEANLESRGCILLDADIPGVTSVDFLAQLRRDGMLIPAIVMSARGDPKIGQVVERLGVALLEKPFAGSDLLDYIEQALRSYRTH